MVAAIAENTSQKNTKRASKWLRKWNLLLTPTVFRFWSLFPIEKLHKIHQKHSKSLSETLALNLATQSVESSSITNPHSVHGNKAFQCKPLLWPFTNRFVLFSWTIGPTWRYTIYHWSISCPWLPLWFQWPVDVERILKHFFSALVVTQSRRRKNFSCTPFKNCVGLLKLRVLTTPLIGI